MISFIVSFFLLASLANQYPQGLVVDLSIEWRTEKIDFKIPPLRPKKAVLIPYLVITYRNGTSDDIYFRKLSYEGKYKYPSVMALIFYNTREDLAHQVQSHTRHSGEDYSVYIGPKINAMSEIGGWDIIKYGEDRLGPRTDENVAKQIADINTVLVAQKKLNDYSTSKQLYCFRYPGKKKISYMKAWDIIVKNEGYGNHMYDSTDLTEQNISTKIPDEFIFLKSKESFTQEFNLTSFYIVGGNFTFTLTDTILTNYLIGREDEKIELPKLINGYKLYTGELTAQPVKLEIDHRKN